MPTDVLVGWRRCREGLARRRVQQHYDVATTPPGPLAWGSFGQAWIVPPVRVEQPGRVFIEDGVVILEDCWMSVALGFPGIEPRLELGERVRVGRSVQFSVAGSVVLERDVLIGDFVQIGDTFHPLESAVRLPELVRPRSVRICAGAVIAGHAVVLPGVTVGAGAVVDHHAVVMVDVPAGAKVAGNPAREVPW